MALCGALLSASSLLPALCSDGVVAGERRARPAELSSRATVPQGCVVSVRSPGRWAFSPFDFTTHLLAPEGDHPAGALRARCGHLLPGIAHVHTQPPYRTCCSCCEPCHLADAEAPQIRPTGPALHVDGAARVSAPMAEHGPSTVTMVTDPTDDHACRGCGATTVCNPSLSRPRLMRGRARCAA
jgi:hypothetical protein